MANELLFDAQDAETTWGFFLALQERALDGSAPVPTEIEIPSMPGALMVLPNRRPVRELMLDGEFDGASQAAVRTNLRKLQAFLLDGQSRTIRMADWSGVELVARCVGFEVNPEIPQQASTAVGARLRFRAANPFWRTITADAITFGSTPTAMPQGTAESYPILTSPVGVLTTPQIKGYDHNDVELWSCTLASLTSGQQYRINTAPGVMSIEKLVGGVWTPVDDAITAGRFPMPLPSNGTAFQSSAWPKLYASTGTWTSTYNRQWL